MFPVKFFARFLRSWKPQMSKHLLIFDVDGTLTEPRLKITDELRKYMDGVRKDRGVSFAVVGGSDLVKIVEQLGEGLEDVLDQYDYVFSENGLVGFKGREALPTRAIQDELGEERLQKLINWTLGYFSQLELPVKRGNFVEFRKGMLNLCPVGRSCTYDERLQFAAYDKEHGVRAKMVDELRKNFGDFGLEFAIGGQISVDVYPVGWDKTYCLRYIENEDFEVLHFFGDKTAPGGNDHAIYEDSRTVGHTVTGPEDTRNQMEKLLQELGV